MGTGPSQWRRFAFSEIKPVDHYPDSTKYYTFNDLLKLWGQSKRPRTTPIVVPDQKKFAELLFKLHKGELGDNPTRYHELRDDLKLTEYDENTVLNAILVSPYEYGIRNDVVYSLGDVVLFLLYAKPEKPIHGRIMITKQVFLAINEVFGKQNVEDPKFVPYKFGPYSFLLTDVLSNLKYDGLIQTDGKKNTNNEKFYLTENGKIIAKTKFEHLAPETRSSLIKRRQGWDQSHRAGIIAYVYNKYPQYTVKSSIKERYKSIRWGRGRG